MNKPFITVVIANAFPLTFQEPVQHRTVRIDLTDEQVGKLKLELVGHSCGNDYHEYYSQAFIEEEAGKA